jgi:Tol biopolymer transport system component
MQDDFIIKERASLKKLHLFTSLTLACSVLFLPVVGHAASNPTQLVFNQASSGTHPSPEGDPIPNTDVFTITASGKSETQRSFMQSSASEGKLSPDGKKLLFRYWDLVADKPFTAVANADGTNVQKVTDASDASWTPDGRIIAVASIYNPVTNSSTNDVVIMNADGSNPQIIQNLDEMNER